MSRFLRGRVGVASLSAVAYPAAALVVAAAVTLAPVPLFAESGAPPLRACESAEFSACADAGELDKCVCATAACACMTSRCGRGATVTYELSCQGVVTCEPGIDFTSCNGKAAGEVCGEARVCGFSSCFIDDGGRYETAGLACVPKPPSSSSPGTPGTSGASTGGSAGPPPSDDGCSVASTPGKAQALAGVLVALLASAALVRRQSRRAHGRGRGASKVT